MRDDASCAALCSHQLDGLEDPTRPWAPCVHMQCASEPWRTDSAGVQRASAVLVFGGLSARDAAIPTFTVGGAGGVILNPEHSLALCGYGIDGSTDFNKPNFCADRDGGCVPGCGAPPLWCNRWGGGMAGGSQGLCGFGWGSSGVQPWRPSDFGGEGGLLDLFAQHGAPYPNDDQYLGYNEIIVSNEAWTDGLPLSVDALFVIAGREDEWADVVDIHQRYLAAYGLSAEEHPLLVLRPWEWNEPFAAAR